jgi:phage-related minor tail protein
MDWLIALSPLGALVLGSFLTYFISRSQIKMTVVCQNRQNWTDTLRDNLAEFMARLYDVYAEMTLLPKEQPRSKEERAKNYMKTNAIRQKIVFSLDSNNEDHSNLLKIMWRMMDTSTYSNEPSQSKKFLEAVHDFTPLAQSILQKEWKRVEKGEF